MSVDFGAFFSSDGYMPHGHCYLWQPTLVWSMVTADTLIGLSYFLISVLLYTLVRRGQLPFRFVFFTFGVFILACGSTHFMEVYTLWIPNYWLASVVKWITAGSSATAALYLAHSFPRVLDLTNAAKEMAHKRTDIESYFRARLSTPPQMRRLLRRVVALPLGLAAILVFAVFFEFNALRLDEDWVSHSNTVIYVAKDLKEFANNAQRDFRGYWFTGFKYLRHAALINQQRFEATAGTLATLVHDNADQVKKLEHIRESFHIWRNFMDDHTPRKAAHRAPEVNQFDRESSVLMNQVATAAEDFLQTETNLRHARELETRRRMYALFFAVGSLTLIFGLIFAVFGRRALSRVLNTYGMALASTKQAQADLQTALLAAQRAEADLQKQEEALRDAVRARDEFLSIASHELRTPLTALKLQLEITNKGLTGLNPPVDKPDLLAQTFTRSLKQVDSLSGLIDVLLDVSRIQTGQLNLNLHEFPLGKLASELLERFSHQFRAVHSVFTVELDESLFVCWDLLRMEQVLSNLLANAIKYAAGSPVRLSSTSLGDRVILVVEDRGPGIASEMQSKIFERFERAGASGKIGGLGLGLFLVKRIVEAHGGTIRLDTSAPSGSRFVLNLPRRVEHPAAADRRPTG